MGCRSEVGLVGGERQRLRPEFTCTHLMRKGASSWATAVHCGGHTEIGAILTAARRLLFLHWVRQFSSAHESMTFRRGSIDRVVGLLMQMQPLAYSIALWHHQHKLGPFEIVFARAVGLRELGYFFLTLVLLLVNPSFLLVDVGASVRDRRSDPDAGIGFFALYVLAPDKFVSMALFGEGGLADDQMLSAAVLGSCTLDICALLGWLAGVVRTDLISQQSAVDYVDSVKKRPN